MVSDGHKAQAPVELALLRTFQKYGYEGASLANLCAETGLIKASLYHRFPAGKEAMAIAALQATEDLFRNDILSPLASDLALDLRLQEVIQRLRRFYGHGRNSCLLDTLSLKGSPASVVKRSRKTAQLCASAFAQFAQLTGMASAEAELAAEQALIQIEGALVLCRNTGTSAPFERALARLPGLLLHPAGRHTGGGGPDSGADNT